MLPLFCDYSLQQAYELHFDTSGGVVSHLGAVDSSKGKMNG